MSVLQHNKLVGFVCLAVVALSCYSGSLWADTLSDLFQIYSRVLSPAPVGNNAPETEEAWKSEPIPLAPSSGEASAWEEKAAIELATKEMLLKAPTDGELEPSAFGIITNPDESDIKYSGGMETFEGAFPGSYWTITGAPSWDDVNCQFYPDGGSWSAWCAGTGTQADCSTYSNNMMPTMYTECDYYGAWGNNTNKFYFKSRRLVEDCCDYPNLGDPPAMPGWQ